MLIKEYRIPLPMTVEEYRIAQLYMIAKKSREETRGTDSGVEILVNEPYQDGPGGAGGQFTHKVYHVGSHLPGWFKSLLPKSALTVEEEAWNAYPYTKTRFKTPFVEKFSLEIETYYLPDGGHQENVFKLSDSELRNRVVDHIDVVRDQIADGATYENPDKEDPTVYVSEKTGRGPLGEDWVNEYWSEIQKSPSQPTPSGKSIMCAYKLCKVEFRYWGMQSKIERFIHDVALRRTMLRAHLQAWIWQDEWHGLTMEDIRAIERETAEQLRRAMHGGDGGEEGADDEGGDRVGAGGADGAAASAASDAAANGGGKMFSSIEYSEQDVPTIVHKSSVVERRRDVAPPPTQQQQQREDAAAAGVLNRSRSVSAAPVSSPGAAATSPTSMINAVSKPGRLAIERGGGGGDNDSEDDDEFFDCRENLDDTSSLARWSSMDLTPQEDFDPRSGLPRLPGSHPQSAGVPAAGSGPASLGPQQSLGASEPQTFRRWKSMREPGRNPVIDVQESGVGGAEGGSASLVADVCSTSVLILVAHGGSVLDLDMEASVRKLDVSTLRGAFESVMRAHYPGMVGQVVVKCVPCPAVCTEALAVLSSLSPYSFDVSPVLPFGGGGATDRRQQQQQQDFFGVSHDRLPVGTIPLLAVSSGPAYAAAVAAFIASANQVYADFLASEAGRGFYGQVVLLGDSMGSILCYDALCHSSSFADSGKKAASDTNVASDSYGLDAAASTSSLLLSAPPSSRGGVSAPVFKANQEFFPSSDSGGSGGTALPPRLDFEVSDFFVFGSPLGLVLAYRKIRQTPFALSQSLSGASSAAADATAPPYPFPSPNRHPSGSSAIPRPAVQQIYNLFHPTDPLGCRLEPLLSARFSRVPPVNVPRYQKYPMGDGTSLSLIEFVQANPMLFASSSSGGGGGGGAEGPGSAGLDGTDGVTGKTRHVSSTSTSSSGGCHNYHRRSSEDSLQSSCAADPEESSARLLQAIGALRPRWWGPRRVDYALYCPEGLANFPTNALPHLFHSSYWESADVIAFILRQLVRPGDSSGDVQSSSHALSVFAPTQPREKWIKKRTSVKIRNGAANHRANDVIVCEGRPQTLVARFSYGPLDMAALTGERVDVHVMKEPPAGEWVLVATELTDKHGRVTHTLSQKHTMGYGIYPVRMVVRGDHTMLHMYLCVVPPRTETVVFSIDGSFAASMSVTGKDPKVKAGAVDVVRHWQELGYLIVYVTGRPDMQLQKVVSWLAQHNFPHGLVSFADGFTTDPLKHKAEFLKSLIRDEDISIHCSYGSSKDITVYTGLGLRPEQIYIVGKANKKQQGTATFLTDGYAEHLSCLTAHGGSRPARGNARMVIPKGNFGLPGQLVRRRTLRGTAAKRTTSYPINSNQDGGGSDDQQHGQRRQQSVVAAEGHQRSEPR